MKTNKFHQHKTFIDDDQQAFIYWREEAKRWYLHIKKQPHWKDYIARSLRTSDKEKALERARLQFNEIMSTHNVMKHHLFTEEDMILATRNQALGRIAEDKFKNLMMLKDYQVYTPVEDIWGSDFILFKNNEYMRVQLKSSSLDQPLWALARNDRIKYKDTCTHMAFVHLMTGKMWLVPVSALPDSTSIRHGKLLQECAKGHEIMLQSSC